MYLYPTATSTQCTLSYTTQFWRACHPDEGKTPFHSWRDCRSYCSFFQSQKPERLLPNLNYALCLFKLWNLSQLSAIYVSQVFSSLMMGHTWPDWTLLCFFLSGGCSCSATLQTCPQEAPDGGTRAGDPRAFSHYKCDFFPASSQASPPSPKVKTCTKHAKLQHEIWCRGFALCIILCLIVLFLRMLHEIQVSEIYISLLKCRLSL